MTAFTELALPAALQRAVDSLGFERMTAVQEQALPELLQGRDMRACAPTGSGKTAAFGLALLAALDPSRSELQSLVLCPTRELAEQVSKDIRALARFMPNIKVASLCGGIPLRPQLASLAHSPHIAVGTPGRILDLIRRKALNTGTLLNLVLDEADRMLDMGFIDDVRKILTATPPARRTWMFSATWPEEVIALGQQFQARPVEVTVALSEDAPAIQQQFFKVEPGEKTNAVVNLLLDAKPESALVFCHTRVDTRQLTEALIQRGISAIGLDGEMDQRDRDETLLQFSNGSRRVLVATDVAARGLDIKALPLVIAFELPHDADTHVHRIGRTGRAGERGTAFTLVAQRELPRLEKLTDQLGTAPQWVELPKPDSRQKMPPPQMCTLRIDAGRRDKLRPGDLLGALTGSAALSAKFIGKIDSFATRSYVAIDRRMIDKAIQGLRRKGIKGRNMRLQRL